MLASVSDLALLGGLRGLRVHRVPELVDAAGVQHAVQYPYMPADEAKYMLHIEDPIDVERNLNCVLNPGSVYKLWNAMQEEAAKAVKAKPRTPAQEVARQGRAVKRAEKA